MRRWLGIGAVAGALLGFGWLNAWSQGFNLLNPNVIGHIVSNLVSGGVPPTTSNGTITAGSTDTAGSVTCTTSANTSCTVTFSVAYNSIPFCVVTDQTTYEGVRVIPTKTNFAITGNAANDVLGWVCIAQPGN